jgi:hypothetical protein
MNERGFTLIETLLAVGLMAAVTAAVFTIVAPAQGTFQAQPEIADMEQRLRVGVDALTRDLLMASSVVPRRVGPVHPDPSEALFDDRISIITATPLDAEPSSRTYYLRREDATLMQYDGDRTDSPVVDHVVGLTFEHLGYPDTRRVHVTLRVEAAPASLRGPAGPLFTRAGTSTSPERFVPDREIRFDVTPRNLEAGP